MKHKQLVEMFLGTVKESLLLEGEGRHNKVVQGLKNGGHHEIEVMSMSKG